MKVGDIYICKKPVRFGIIQIKKYYKVTVRRVDKADVLLEYNNNLNWFHRHKDPIRNVTTEDIFKNLQDYFYTEYELRQEKLNTIIC